VKPVRFGLIGCGRVARYHAQALTEIEGSELVAVCDILPERADDFSRRYGGDSYYDYRELLERKDVDVVALRLRAGIIRQSALMQRERASMLLRKSPLA